MQNKLVSLAFIAILSGCATTEPVINTIIQKEEIPVAVACKVDIPIKPILNFDKVTADQDIFDKTKALLADRKLSQGYEGLLLAALITCVK